MAPSPSEAFWYLRPGLLLPTAAVLAVLNLERAGHRLSLDAHASQIHLEPAPGVAVDAHDLAELRRWKAHAILFMRYTPDDSPRRALRPALGQAPAGNAVPRSAA